MTLVAARVLAILSLAGVWVVEIGARRAQTVAPGLIEWRLEAGFAPLSRLPDAAAAASTWMPQPDGGELESFGKWYIRVSADGRSPYASLLDSPRNPWDHT